MRLVKDMVVIGASLILSGSGFASAKQTDGAEQAQIAKMIQARLQGDPDLKNNRLDVEVQNSVVVLKGTVDTQSERSKAETLARVEGVARVDNRLDVGSKSAGAAISDTAITTKIKAEIMGDDTLRHSDISVTTNNGVVILKGTVQTQAARDHAVAVAQKTDGVKRVADNLRVNNDQTQASPQ